MVFVVPVGIKLHSFDGEGADVCIFPVLHLHAAHPRHLIGCEGQEVFILRQFVHILDDDVDRLLDVVLLQGDDMDQVGVLENLWGLEGRVEADGRPCEARAGKRRQAQKRGQDCQ